MWIWKNDHDRLWRELRHAEVAVARLEAENKILLEQAALTQKILDAAEARNQSIFDALMQVKFQHPGTSHQDAMKTMFQDSETLMAEDPEELRKYHARMKEIVDAGGDPGMLLLEEMDDLRSDDIFGPGLPDGS